MVSYMLNNSVDIVNLVLTQVIFVLFYEKTMSPGLKILISEGQCSRNVKIVRVRGDIITFVTVL